VPGLNNEKWTSGKHWRFLKMPTDQRRGPLVFVRESGRPHGRVETQRTCELQVKAATQQTIKERRRRS